MTSDKVELAMAMEIGLKYGESWDDEFVCSLLEAIDGDACLSLQISGLSAMAWHLEQGHDNAKIGREALALALRGIEKRLKAIALYSGIVADRHRE